MDTRRRCVYCQIVSLEYEYFNYKSFQQKANICSIVGGVIYTAGQQFVSSWQVEFNTSRGSTAMIVSLQSGFHLLSS